MNLQELSFFYNNLAVMLNAGIGLVQQLETVRGTERNSERKKKINFIIEELKHGRTLAESLRKTDLLPIFDIPVIESGEKSGMLPHVFNILSKNYALSAQAEKNVRSGLAYPFFMFTAALFVPDFPKLFLGQITPQQYFISNLTVILIVLLLAFTLYKIFMQTYFDLDLAKTRHQVFLHLPFLRGLTQKMALEKFCSSMALMLEAGIPIFDALKLSGQTSPEYQITLACHRIVSEVKAGKSLPQAFQMESIFNDDIKNSIALGNESGKLPAFLNRSAELLKTQVSASIEKISRAVPILIYWSVLLYVAWSLLSLYIGNINMLNDVLSGS